MLIAEPATSFKHADLVLLAGFRSNFVCVYIYIYMREQVCDFLPLVSGAVSALDHGHWQLRFTLLG